MEGLRKSLGTLALTLALSRRLEPLAGLPASVRMQPYGPGGEPPWVPGGGAGGCLGGDPTPPGHGSFRHVRQAGKRRSAIIHDLSRPPFNLKK